MKKSELRQMIQEEIRRLTEAATVDTGEYERAHGKKPTGSGGWAFRLAKSKNDQDGDVIWPGRGAMKFADALALAKKEAKETGMPYIIVMP